MKNVCIVGYGAIGPVHAAAIEKLNSAKLYAVCDVDTQKLINCTQLYSVITYTDFDKMLSDSNIDCVHICTPHYLHFEMIKKALLAGKEVVCEKPLTMTKQEYDELLATENSDSICVVLQNRINPCVKKLKEIVENGILGDIQTVKGILTWCRTKEYYSKDTWRGKWLTEGGGVLINQAIHTLDFFSYIADDIVSVKAQKTNFSIKDIEVEDTFVSYFKFKKGANGIFFATNSYGDNSAPQFEIIFEQGIARYIDGKLFINDELIEEDLKPSLGKTYWGRGHEKLLENYYDKNIYFSPSMIKNTMNTMFAMYKSADEQGKEILL